MADGCFHSGLGQSWFELTLGEALISIPIISLALAALVAPVVLAFYQSHVRSLMRSGRAMASAAGTLSLPAAPEGDVATLSAFATRQETGLRRALTIAVAAFAIPTFFIFLFSPDEPGQGHGTTLVEWFLSTLVYALFIATLCLPIILLGTSSLRFTRLFWSLFAPLYVVTVALVVFTDDTMTVAEQLLDGLIGTLLLLVLYAGLGGRRMRNVVPMLSVLFGMLWIALVFFGAAMGVADACLDPESALYLIGSLTTLVGSLWLVYRLAFHLLDRLARAFERKAMSGTQFQIGIWSLIVASIFVVGAGPDQDELTWWAAAVVVAFGFGLWIYARQISRLTMPQDAPLRLLMLRVFASDNRGEKLLDEIAFRWRFMGPIFLVGGPDLAQANLDPHELFALLQRRLRDMFIIDQDDLARHLATIDERPDPDTRYRVNEFFCSDDTWRATVKSLVGGMHAILLDLRGFTALRRGTGFEVALLASKGLLERSVILIDGATDLTAVEDILEQAGGTSLARCVVIDTRHNWNPDNLLEALLGRAILPATGVSRAPQPA